MIRQVSASSLHETREPGQDTGTTDSDDRLYTEQGDELQLCEVGELIDRWRPVGCRYLVLALGGVLA
jgi:hypothetical protein